MECIFCICIIKRATYTRTETLHYLAIYREINVVKTRLLRWLPSALKISLHDYYLLNNENIYIYK